MHRRQDFGLTASRLSKILLMLVVVVSIVPLLVARIPGFVDMPSHMARHVILALQDRDDPLFRYFSVSWHWIANLGVDLPAVLLARWLGADLATRVISALIAPLTILGLAALSRVVHGRITASVALALPLVFNQAWMWGFLNYCLSTALALLVAAWSIGRPKRGIVEQLALGGAALAVWTAHMAGWAVLLVIVAGAELAHLRKVRDLGPALLRNLPLLMPVIPLLAWRAQAAGPQVRFVYVDFLNSKMVVFASVLRGTDKLVDLALLAMIGAGCLLALAWAGRPRLAWPLLGGGLLLALCALLAPTTILNAWGTDLRLAPVALMLMILAIGPATTLGRNGLVCVIGLGLFALRLASITSQWAHHGEELEQRLALLDAVPVGGKLGFLYVPQGCKAVWRLEPDNKLASYAVPRRHAFVNTLFMVDNAKLVRMRAGGWEETLSEGSQVVPPLCPNGRVDGARIARMGALFRRNRFDAIWISGVDRQALPAIPGYAIYRAIGRDIVMRPVF